MSPTVFRFRGYRFFFFSREETRPHIHVMSEKGEAKVWVEPVIGIASSTGYTRRELNQIVIIVRERRDEIVQAWKKHFSR